MSSLFTATLFLFLFYFQSTVWGLSSTRYPSESSAKARVRNLIIKRIVMPERATPSPISVLRASAVEGRKDIRFIEVSDVPELKSMDELFMYFKLVRDTRFLNDPERNFLRRPSWLFPDDGCYARAEVAKNELLQRVEVPPKKMFVFGDLVVRTPNSPYGVVTWWYHVALTYRVNKSIFVLDPSIDPHRPLLLKEWDQQVGGSKAKTAYSLCTHETFDPEQDCQTEIGADPNSAIVAQELFLPYEWDRLHSLGRDPEQELGDLPPWK